MQFSNSEYHNSSSIACNLPVFHRVTIVPLTRTCLPQFARSAAASTEKDDKGRVVPAFVCLLSPYSAHRQVPRHPQPRPCGPAVPASSSSSSSSSPARARTSPRSAPLRPVQGRNFGCKCESDACAVVKFLKSDLRVNFAILEN